MFAWQIPHCPMPPTALTLSELLNEVDPEVQVYFAMVCAGLDGLIERAVATLFESPEDVQWDQDDVGSCYSFIPWRPASAEEDELQVWGCRRLKSEVLLVASTVLWNTAAEWMLGDDDTLITLSQPVMLQRMAADA